MRLFKTATLLIFYYTLVAWNANATSPVDSDRFLADTPPPLQGPYAPNESLRSAEILGAGQLQGPEDIAIAHDGTIYTGSADGTVKRIFPNGSVETFAETGGHPLGMDFDEAGNLIVCEPYSGLLSIDPNGVVTLLSTEAEGVPYQLVDDVKVASDGRYYFTDASAKFGLDDFKLDILESRPNGRLLRYDPVTESVEVLIPDLYFANGVAFSEDESFVLVNETGRYKITRLWLKGEKSGLREEFISNLPGSPDGLSLGPDGNFYVAMFSVRDNLIDWLHKFPKLKNALALLPQAFFPVPEPYGFVIVLNPDAEPVTSYHDTDGSVLTAITSVEVFNGALYMGSLNTDFIGRLPL